MAENVPRAKKTRYDLRNIDRINYNIKKRSKKQEIVLYDDCWLKVFEFSTPSQMGNLSQVNMQLNELTKYYLRFKHKLLQLDENYNFETIDGSLIDVDAAELFLAIHGKNVQKLTVDKEYFREDDNDQIYKILALTEQYCNLKWLTIKGFELRGMNLKCLKNDSQLTLKNCTVNHNWRNVERLETLELINVSFYHWRRVHEGSSTLISDTGPVRLIRHLRGEFVEVPFPVDRFGSLKNLNISLTNLSEGTIIDLIYANPYLVNLTIRTNYATKSNIITGCIKQLKKLKMLKLSFNGLYTQHLINGLLRNRILLEHLELGIYIFTT